MEESPTLTSDGTGGFRVAKIPLKYQRVGAEIRQSIQALPVGTRLPSESDLAKTCRCSFLTVRKALKEMVDDGTIIRRVGSGTFIARCSTDEPSVGASTAGDQARVGVLVYEGANAYGDRVLQSLTRAGIEEDVRLQTEWVADFGDKAIAQVERFKRGGCIAVTLPWFPHDMTDEVRLFVRRSPLPVSLPLLIPGLERNCFVQPELFGADHIIEDLCRYFHAQGRRRIALIGPNSKNDVVLQKRVTDFIRFTSDANLPSPCGLVAPGALAMDQLADRWRTYCGDLAIISYDDEHALRFMTAMHKLGLHAPADFCILGYNDTEASRYSDPPLTTVHQRFEHIGHGLIKNALALPKGEVWQFSEVSRLTLVVRASCGGLDRIDDTFRSQFRSLDLALPHGEASPTLAVSGAATPTPFVSKLDAE